VRDAAVGLLVVTLAAAGGAGCDGAPKTLRCSSTVDAYCAMSTSDCVRTWDDAQSDGSFCAEVSAGSVPRRADCGAYHVVSVGIPDATGTYYYDGTTGMLVAIVVASGFTNSTTCEAGPTGGFTLPTCTGAGSEPLSQCADGGTD
jgi:hypothetical protein